MMLEVEIVATALLMSSVRLASFLRSTCRRALTSIVLGFARRLSILLLSAVWNAVRASGDVE